MRDQANRSKYATHIRECMKAKRQVPSVQVLKAITHDFEVAAARADQLLASRRKRDQVNGRWLTETIKHILSGNWDHIDIMFKEADMYRRELIPASIRYFILGDNFSAEGQVEIERLLKL